jgi:hypothetical protein
MTLHEWCLKHDLTVWHHPARGAYYIPDGTWENRAELWRLDDFCVESVMGGTIWLVPRPAPVDARPGDWEYFALDR